MEIFAFCAWGGLGRPGVLREALREAVCRSAKEGRNEKGMEKESDGKKKIKTEARDRERND